MNTLRTLVVEDHEVMRFGLVMLLNREPDIKVVAEAHDGRHAIEQLAAHEVDVVLLDLTLPDMEGLQLIKLIQARWPGLPVLVSSMHEELRYGPRALAAGALGYVMKSRDPRDLMEAVRTVARGEKYVSEELRKRMAPTEIEEEAPEYARVPLTDRELEVLTLLGRGLSSSAIADHLHRSVKTIDAHRENIKKKLALRNVNELLCYAVWWVEEETRGNKPAPIQTQLPEATATGQTLPLPLALR